MSICKEHVDEEENQNNKTKTIKAIIQDIFSEIVKYVKLHIERLHCISDNIDHPQKMPRYIPAKLLNLKKFFFFFPHFFHLLKHPCHLSCSISQSLDFADYTLISSVQFSCSVVSDSFQLHESQHARPPCPSPTPGVHSNSYALSR